MRRYQLAPTNPICYARPGNIVPGHIVLFLKIGWLVCQTRRVAADVYCAEI